MRLPVWAKVKLLRNYPTEIADYDPKNTMFRDLRVHPKSHGDWGSIVYPGKQRFTFNAGWKYIMQGKKPVRWWETK